MYNLNVNLAATAACAANSLLVESTCNTPRTPEILNSLIAMTNPLDSYAFGEDVKISSSNASSALTCMGATAITNTSSDSNSSSSSQLGSPTSHNPPSIQHTCSQLIKAGLKLTIEQKRKHQSDGEDLLDLDKVKRIKKNDCSESEEDKIKQENGVCLTPEDEERRRRRRERNKIAATKCRLKKRERTANLIHESETLETQNIELKNQLQELQNQQSTLTEILSMHRPHCRHNIGPATKESLCRLPPVASVMESHSYSRPASVDPSFRNHNIEAYSRSTHVASLNNNSSTYSRSSHHNSYTKPPSIIVEEVGDYEISEFTNLDSIDSYPYTSSPTCHSSNNYGGSQSYSTNNGLDSGCMA